MESTGSGWDKSPVMKTFHSEKPGNNCLMGLHTGDLEQLGGWTGRSLVPLKALAVFGFMHQQMILRKA